jgi:uncharacterized protein
VPSLTRPGVYVSETTFPTFVAATPGQAVAAFVGPHSQGPLVPTVINSWAQFVSVFGGFGVGYPPSNLALAVYNYFGSGGTSCVVTRAVASTSGPASAQFSFIDNSSVTVSTISAVTNPSNPAAITTTLPHGLSTGQQVVITGVAAPLVALNATWTVTVTGPSSFTVPLAIASTWVSGGTVTPTAATPTLLLSATNPGAWGSQLYVDILPGTDAATNPQTFTIVVKLGGTAAINVVESWQNVTMTPGSTSLGAGNYAPTVINNNSAYLVATDQNSGELGSVKNPKVTVSSQQLLGGSDGVGAVSSPDLDAAVASLDAFPDQPFTLNLPGNSNATDLGNAITRCINRGDMFLVVDTPSGLSPANAVAFAATLPATSFAAVYYPWININDPYTPTLGSQRLVPPGGFMSGVIAATDVARGVGKSPAGLQAVLPTAIGVERSLTNADKGVLNAGNVNAILTIPRAGTVCFGARTLSNLLSTRYINVRRSLIYLRTTLISLTSFAVFEPNDSTLWTQINGIISQFLTSFWQSGGLSGQAASQAFFIVCDGSNNTPSTIQQGLVNIQVGVALQRPAEFAVLTLSQWAGGSTSVQVAA